MTKRLKKSEFMMAYMIIITLACTVGGFFFGAHYMKTKIETEQAAVLEKQKQEAEKEKLLQSQKLYGEQDIIRFYYAVYGPVLDLKNKHFATMEKWQALNKKEQAEALEQLIDSAEETLENVQKSVPLQTSPLLIEARAHFTNSVRVYLDSMEQVRSDHNSNALTQSNIAERLTLFQNEWQTAQKSVFQAIATWESAYVVGEPLPAAIPTTVSVSQWKQYPFHYRTYLAAAAMSADKLWNAYNPEDLTARLDLLFAKGDAQSLGIHDVTAAIRLLKATDAVHAGDFKELKSQLYSSLQVPEIPLYK